VGGDKLAGALSDLDLSPQDRVCLDVGASTGGFTDCLVKNGAKRVYAIDVGKGQMVPHLQSHPKVVSIEKTHILNLQENQLSPKPTFAVIDVSFISLKKVIPKVKMLIQTPGTICAMLKPQFEVGPKNLKKGVVRSEAVQNKCVKDMIEFGKSLDLEFLASAPAKLKGPKGNQEYFLHFEKVNSFI